MSRPKMMEGRVSKNLSFSGDVWLEVEKWRSWKQEQVGFPITASAAVVALVREALRRWAPPDMGREE